MARSTVSLAVVETPGEPVAPRCQPAEDAAALAVRCLNEALDEAGIKREWFAREVCGLSPSQLSRVINGLQGNPHALPLPDEVRAAWHRKLHEATDEDPLVLAASQAMTAMVRFLKIAAAAGFKARMAKARL